MTGILSEIVVMLKNEMKKRPSPQHSIIGIRVGPTTFHQMCTEDPKIYDTCKFLGIPIWQSEIEIEAEVIYGIVP